MNELIVPGGIITIILLIVLCETTAMSCVKKYHGGDGSFYFIIAILFYALVCILLSHSLDYKNSIGMVNVAWSGLSVLAVALTGVLAFKETVHKHDIFAGLLITAGMLIFKYTN